jgi:DNA polymerase-3 subunit alpha
MLDGACRVDKMLELAIKYEMPAVAMTDHGNMFGTIDFYNKAKALGIKPIIGIETYIVNNDLDDPDSKKDKRHHLVLLAKNSQGYRNLMKISSLAFTDGFYYKPRISKKILQQYAEGLICSTACLQGEIPHLLLNKRKEEALQAIQWYKDIFADDFFIELQDHGLEMEKEVAPLLIQIAEETKTEMIVTNDCHYLNNTDAEAHDILLCIQTGKNLHDQNRMRYKTDQLYFKNEFEMRQLFPQLPQAYDNTVKIAESINLELEYNDFIFPHFEIPPQYKDMADYIRSLCLEAVDSKYESGMTDEIQERLDFELDVINKMGYNGYFLIVKDFIDAARADGIPVGPGRGSAAGSIVSYLLDITRMDPLKYGLLFERFLDVERVGMPDIDIDICSINRNRVIDYVVEKYGRSSVTQIVTFGTLGAKSVIKDVARVLEVPAVEANKITKMMPSTPKITLQKALEESPEFCDYINSNELNKTILKHSFVLEGLIRQTGIHAAGVVIGPGDLSDYVPLAVNKQKTGESAVVVQYEGKWLDDLKMLKMDFLGLKTLSILDRTVKLVQESQDIKIDIDNIPLDDKPAYELLSQGKTDGIFQFESGGMKKYLSELKPNVFEDLIAMVALYRPGPMQFIKTFINRKHGKEPVEYDHPLTEETLRETYGVTVYQEQVMNISKRMAGFSSAEAGTLRKAIGKKKMKLMAKMEIKFIDGAVKNGVSEVIARKIWSDWLEFANYAFNKSHAACYAYIAYQTAYLKANYPVEFMAALLSLEENPSKIPYFISECKSMNIEVIPPHLNNSDTDFRVEGNKILFGLKAIKNVGIAAIKSMIEERDKNGEFQNLFEFSSRVDLMCVNKTTLESLICAGAMDNLEGTRSQKYASIENALEYASCLQTEKKRGQFTLFDAFEDDDEQESYFPELPQIKEWSPNQIWEKEKEVLGFSFSPNPLAQHEKMLKLMTNADTETAEYEPNKIPSLVNIAGIVAQVIRKKDKRGNPFAIVELEDLHGSFEVLLFRDDFDQYIQMMQEGKQLYISGKRSTYNNQDGVIRVIPTLILDFVEMPNYLRGDIYFKLDEKKATQDLAESLVKLFKEHKGKFGLHISVQTEKFKQLNLIARNYKIFPDVTILKLLEDKMVSPPKVVYDF